MEQKDAKVEEKTILECNNCKEEVYTCDGCKEYFKDGDDIFCGEQHLCNACKVRY